MISDINQDTRLKERINILHVIGTLDRGGAETFLMNVLRNIDRTRFNFVFLCFGNADFDYEDEAIALGATVSRIPAFTKKHMIRNVTSIMKVIKQERIDIVHTHIYYDSVFALIAAKLTGTNGRFTHSHNTHAEEKPSYVKKIYHSILKAAVNLLTTKRLACGEDAGNSLFYKKSEFQVVHNGIAIEDFAYSEQNRHNIRTELKVPLDSLIVLHAGRFHAQKNHAFVIEIFSEYRKLNPKAHLVLVGDGPLRSSIENKVAELSLRGSVTFLGKRTDMNKIFSASDIFLFPSLYEGLPVVMIEAQASSIKSLVSDTIDPAVKQTDTVEFYPLSKHASEWANKISAMNLARVDSQDTMLNSSYNIKINVKNIEKIYEESA